MVRIPESRTFFSKAPVSLQLSPALGGGHCWPLASCGLEGEAVGAVAPAPYALQLNAPSYLPIRPPALLSLQLLPSSSCHCCGTVRSPDVGHHVCGGGRQSL